MIGPMSAWRFIRFAWLMPALALIGATAWFSPLRGTAMNDEKIMMYAGGSLFGELFDATSWFASGMYRRDLYPDERRGFAQVGMTRIAPPPFPDSQLEELRIRIAGALDRSEGFDDVPRMPEAAIEKVRDQDFDPRPQIVYSASGFDAPDEPVDTYIFYMLYEGKRYFVTFDRDPVSGEIIMSSRDISLKNKEEEERRFRELEEQEKLAAWRNAPGLRARSGQPCPYPGTWECLECAPGLQNQRNFMHAATLPQVDGRDVTWRMVRAYE